MKEYEKLKTGIYIGSAKMGDLRKLLTDALREKGLKVAYPIRHFKKFRMYV